MSNDIGMTTDMTDAWHSAYNQKAVCLDIKQMIELFLLPWLDNILMLSWRNYLV